MESKRDKIDSLRQKLQERNADSNFTNKFLYGVLMEHAKWLIKREVSAGRIYTNSKVFQPHVISIIEVPAVDPCLNIKTGCTLYRSKNLIPEIWVDNAGPIIRSITSVDGSTDFDITSSRTWNSKEMDPYQKRSKSKYVIYENGYLWFPKYNPHKAIVNAFFIDDVNLFSDDCEECDNKKKCVRFLDTKFFVPEWIEAELMSKALEQMAGITKRLVEDTDINKNPNRKN